MQNKKTIKDIYKLLAKNRHRLIVVAKQYTDDETTIDDVVQEQLLYFMQMNQQTLMDIYEKDGLEGLIKYGAVAIYRSLHSNTSSYFYKYRKYYTKINDGLGENNFTADITQIPNQVDEHEYKNQLLKTIEEKLEKMYWYDSRVFKIYYEEKHTLDSLAKKTGISRNSLHSTIKKVRKKLLKILDDEIFCDD